MTPSLRYLFVTFLKIGATAWGGFMALIAVVQKQMERDKVIDNETILDGISLAAVLPGPTAVNVVSFIGYKLRGIKGTLVCMAGIILPSFLLMLLLASFYDRFGQSPASVHFFEGVLPAVAALIASVAFDMFRKSVVEWRQGVIVVLSTAIITASKSYASTVLVLVAAGLAGWLMFRGGGRTNPVIPPPVSRPRKARGGRALVIVVAGLAVGVGVLLGLSFMPAGWAEAARLHRTIMITFSGMSLSLFGGGYVVIPAMQKVVVDSLHWLSHREFADAIAMGQVTPGPIFISATLIGYKVGGFWGALNATLSIFLPPALLMVGCAHFLERIKTSSLLPALFKGLRPAIIGMIFSAALTILLNNDFSRGTAALFLVSLIVAIRYKVNPVVLIPAAGLFGLLVF